MAPQICFLWAPLNFDDAVVHYIVFEDADGEPWSEGGAVLPVIGPGDPTVGPGVTFDHIHDVELDVTWEPGLRRLRRAELSFQRLGQDARELVALEPQLTFRMSGVGYGHPTWNHGRWHDELVVAGEAVGVDEIDDTAVPPPPRAASDEGDVGRPGRPRRARADRHRPAPARGLTGLNDGAPG